jgi:hypothetical protein
MAVFNVAGFHVRPGKYAELFDGLKSLKELAERKGATVRVLRQIAGPQLGDVALVLEHADWGEWAKGRSDPEVQQALERRRSDPNPPADLTAAAMWEEVLL